MRVLSLASAILIAATALAPQTADAALTKRHRHGDTMNVRLANGRTVMFHIVRMNNGQMMVMAPYNSFRDVFHGTSQ